ncbi:MAG: FHA domain-containing protein [Solirubrobacteraceae bacterium]
MAAATPSNREPEPANPLELRAISRAEREGEPFFVFKDGDGRQRIVRFAPDRSELTVGRDPGADLCVGWDSEVSGKHAHVQQFAGELILVDDGPSRNGSFVNGDPVTGRRRLRDRDKIRFGRTVVLVRHPTAGAKQTKLAVQSPVRASSLTDQQRKVLIALCRPLIKDGSTFATAATDQEIADELCLSADAVKLHLSALFDKFNTGDVPEKSKRLALAFGALQSGLLTARLATVPPASGGAEQRP